MCATYQSAEIVKTATGRQYHIGLAPGEVAPFVLLCGDPQRAARTAACFDKVRLERTCREYLTLTGTYQRIPVSVMATGMGPDNTEIAVVELSQVVENPALIRIGSSGALREEVGLGELVVSTGAVRLENTSTGFVPEGYPAVAHYEVILALLQAARSLRVPVHLGLTATGSGFYGAQSRAVPGFPPRYPDRPEQLGRLNVLNFEMESSTLFSLATLRGYRCGTVCAVYANRPANRFIDAKTKERAEEHCFRTGLEAVRILAEMDRLKKRRRAANWLPSMQVAAPRGGVRAQISR